MCKLILLLKINCNYRMMLCDASEISLSSCIAQKIIMWLQDKPNKSSQDLCWYPQRENPPFLTCSWAWNGNIGDTCCFYFYPKNDFVLWSVAVLLSTKASSLLFLGASIVKSSAWWRKYICWSLKVCLQNIIISQ